MITNIKNNMASKCNKVYPIYRNFKILFGYNLDSLSFKDGRAANNKKQNEMLIRQLLWCCALFRREERYFWL